MKVCAVTCTGGRPEMFALCKRWVQRQTVRPDHWLVVTDNGETIGGLPSWAEHRHVGHAPEFDYRTDCDAKANMALWNALGLVPPDHAVVVFEDDDWYSKDHIRLSMQHMLSKGHMAVYGRMWFRFHLPLSSYSTKPVSVPSEGRVTMHPDAVVHYRAGLQQRKLWRGPTDGVHYLVTTVGIKGVGNGLPGRGGATPLHASPGFGKWRPDPGHRMFRRHVGNKDAQAYLDLLTHESHSPS